jgi:hypothetical protein
MRLPASLRGGLYAVGGIVALSGVAWLVAREPAQRAFALLCLEIHGATAAALLVLIGAVAALHAPAGWRERKNRGSGALVVAVLAMLAITGVLLYYLGDERMRGVVSIAHWAVGLAAPAALTAHVWLGLRAAKGDSPSRR